jgi:hypothetical protein
MAGLSYVLLQIEIKLGRKQIRLVPVGGADEEE